ncbi:MAG: ATP-binding protein [Marinobacter sp.]|nr:ATP-binding protein [Marinobacter sp.]
MIRKKQNKTLGRQLLWLGALPAIVMFVVLMGFFTSARLDDARTDLYNSNQTLADNLAPAVEYAVVSGNGDALKQIIERSLRRSNAEWIRVSDIGGTQVGFVSRDGSETAQDTDGTQVFESDILQQPLSMNRDDRMDWFEPDYNLGSGAMRIGTVEVGVSEERLASRREDIIWTSLGVGLSLLIFTLIVVSRMLDNIVGPIYGLSQRVRDLIDRQYEPSRGTPPNASAEIVELDQNLNALASHLANLRSANEASLELSEHARERAESANVAKSEFLAIMSHELRTPLNGVLGMLQLIAEEPLSDNQKDYLTTASQSTEDLLTVISDILDFSRVDRGKLVLDYARFDLRDLISNCCASHRHLSEQNGLTLSCEFTGQWPTPASEVLGDAPRLRQVLACLLDNAIKFTDEGSITVTSDWQTLEDNCVILTCEVRDSGRGMPVERMKDAFSSFGQLDSSHTRQQGGTGIGLALVQRLVELMGGHIRVETDIGAGSSFKFELPFEYDVSTGAEPERTTTPEPAMNPGQDKDRARALVVEDNPVNQRVATALLTRLGFETDYVENGQQAVDRVRASHRDYAVILMDCQMPLMDGYEATRTIRDWENLTSRSPTPIIALTADALPGTEIACREAGMNDYISKPVRKERLRDILSRWIKL